MMNYELEDYIVQDPYQPTEKEKLAIEELTNRGLVPEVSTQLLPRHFA